MANMPGKNWHRHIDSKPPMLPSIERGHGRPHNIKLPLTPGISICHTWSHNIFAHDILSLLSLSTFQTKAIRTIVRHLGPDSSHQNVPDSGRNHESRGLQLAGPDVRAKNATYSFAHPRGRPSPRQGSWLWNQPCWYVSPSHPSTHLMIPNGPGVVSTCRNVHPPRSLAGY